jgi:hypothetical protein
MDNNVWDHSLKVDLNNFNGSNPLGWVIQMELYFSLQGITNDMMTQGGGLVSISTTMEMV